MTKFLRRYYNLPLVIEKNGVMDEGTKKYLRRFFIGIIVYGLLLLYLYLHTAVTAVGYRLDKLSGMHRQLSNQHSVLLLELGRRAGWKDTEELARSKYGFVDPFHAREIILPVSKKQRRWWDLSAWFEPKAP